MTFIDTSRLESKIVREGWTGRFFHSAQMTFAYYSVDAGASIHEHQHANDEVWNVLSGALAITVAGITEVVGPGGAVVIPPHALHSIRAMSQSSVIVVDQPRRASIGGITL